MGTKRKGNQKRGEPEKIEEMGTRKVGNKKRGGLGTVNGHIE